MPSTNTAAIEADGEVMAAVDPDGTRDRLVIADVTRDDAWLSAPLTAATPLSEWE